MTIVDLRAVAALVVGILHDSQAPLEQRVEQASALIAVVQITFFIACLFGVHFMVKRLADPPHYRDWWRLLLICICLLIAGVVIIGPISLLSPLIGVSVGYTVGFIGLIVGIIAFVFFAMQGFARD